MTKIKQSPAPELVVTASSDSDLEQAVPANTSPKKFLTWPFVLLLAVLMLVPVTLQSFAGVGFAQVLSGSMQPKLNVGDVAVTVQTRAADLEVGNVVSLVDTASNQKYMHRIIYVYRDAGAVLIHTKGDNNPVMDGTRAIVSENLMVPKLVTKLPGTSSLYEYVNSATGRFYYGILLGFTALMLVVRSVLLGIQKRRSTT
jgi:signal peptidase I